MNVICSRSELREALRIVASVVDPRNIKPILKDIRVRTTQDALELSATDLEVGIKYFVRDAEIKAQGGIVVPATPLDGIVSESRNERLSLKTKETALLVEGTGSRFQISGVSEEEFPEIPDFPEGNCLEVEGAVLREMIEKTIFAVSVEKQRYALNGVLLVTKEKAARIEMVGTDGHRLAVIRRKANAAVPFSASAILSVKALQQTLKMISDEEIIKVSVHERQILIHTEKGTLVAQLVEGRFPEYKDVIPDDCDKKLEIDAEELANAIRQAAVLSSAETRAVWFKLDKNSLVIESSNPELGEARVETAAKYEGDPVQIRFNPDFVLDGLKAMDKEAVRLEMKEAGRAAVMRASADYLYLVMPIVQD
jgi:DNA polymerase-3 subunit beta